MQLDVPILIRPFSPKKVVIPVGADQEFWVSVMMTRP
jgi:hypothetical protein